MIFLQYSEASREFGRLAQLVRASRLHREGRRFESYGVYHFFSCGETYYFSFSRK